jgi:hypothetical protein
MTFTVSEIYLEAIRQDTTSEYLDIKAKLTTSFNHRYSCNIDNMHEAGLPF